MRTRRIAQRRQLSGRELKAHLAQHDIEFAIPEGQRLRVPLPPIDRHARRGRRGGYRQHSGVNVEAGCRTRITDALRRQPGHDPGATGDIEHALTRLEVCLRDEILRHGRANVRNKEAFIVPGRIVSDSLTDFLRLVHDVLLPFRE